MQVSVVKSAPTATADAVVVGMFPGLRAAAGSQGVFRALGGWARKALESVGFEGKLNQTAVLASAGNLQSSLVVVVGLGDELDTERLRQAAGSARRAVSRSASIATTLHRVDLNGATQAVLEGMGLASYSFDTYKSSSEARDPLSLELIGSVTDWEPEAERARTVVEAVSLARDLVNEPSAAKGPLALAERSLTTATEAGLEGEIWDTDRLSEERMAGTLAVGAGSHRPPCMLILRHRPRRPRAKLILIGKGIVFDSGGLNIKSAEYMDTMKTDMAGAAAVIGAMVGLARLGVPVEVTAYTPLAENLPGGGAQRPGDVIRYRNNKTIEVLNTDAEGRLVLADALCLASEARPDLIVDVATLTGAAKVALGVKIAGVWGRDTESVDRVVAAADSAGERVWPMPLPDDYRSLISSEIADMKNTSGRYGGAIGAALLLSEFVDDCSWAHIDVAGPARSEETEHYIPKGGSGFGVRTLIELAESFVKR